MPCCNCFNDFIVKCNDEINVFAQLAPTQTYTWRITAANGNIYQHTFTTDENGFWSIPVTDLPDGLLTPYSGDFTLEVFTQNNMPVAFRIAQEYNCINFSVKGGSAIKDHIGLEFSCVEGSLNPIVTE